MSLSVGIIGLPNVGKSTLFNALRVAQSKPDGLALVANYPFATIEPNVGIVPVPDERLEKINETTVSEILKPFSLAPLGLSSGRREGGQVEDDKSKWPPIVPATVQFVDIAGLVKGAAQGAGLGNKFLAHIREVDVICHVVRAFADENIIREGSTDPRSDIEVVRTELILADLQTVTNHEARIKNQGREKETLDKLKQELDIGKCASDIGLTEEEKDVVKDLHLLTSKPVIYVFNTTAGANGLTINYEPGSTMNSLAIDAKLESEIAGFSQEEQKEYLESVGVKESGLNQLVRKAYGLLGLQSFFTTGEKETRAWTLRRGETALRASGVIHTDFMKGFIKAEVISYDDFITVGGWKKGRELGKVRLEGKEYVMQEGDIVEFKVNV